MIAAAVAPTASHLARGLPARRAAPASARAVPAPRRAAGPAAPAPRRVVVRAGETETAAGELMGIWLMWGGAGQAVCAACGAGGRPPRGHSRRRPGGSCKPHPPTGGVFFCWLGRATCTRRRAPYLSPASSRAGQEILATPTAGSEAWAGRALPGARNAPPPPTRETPAAKLGVCVCFPSPRTGAAPLTRPGRASCPRVNHPALADQVGPAAVWVGRKAVQ